MATPSSSKGTKGLKSKNRSNKNVSVSPLTRQDKVFINSLRVQTDLSSKHGNSRSVCWNYFGKLHYESGNGEKDYVLDDRLYCSLCLAEVKKKEISDTATCHISKISNFSVQTSSGNLILHLSNKHEIETMPEEKVNKIVDYFRSYSQGSLSSTSTNPTAHEFSRDIMLWFSRDLLPFSTVSSEGFKEFFGKYLPTMSLPC